MQQGEREVLVELLALPVDADLRAHQINLGLPLEHILKTNVEITVPMS